MCSFSSIVSLSEAIALDLAEEIGTGEVLSTGTVSSANVVGTERGLSSNCMWCQSDLLDHLTFGNNREAASLAEREAF